MRRMDEFERRLDELVRALYGHPSLGQKGFREEIEKAVVKLEGEITTAKELCEGLVRQDEQKAAEQRGRDRVIGYTGVTSLLTLLTVVGLLVAIWNGIGGG